MQKEQYVAADSLEDLEWERLGLFEEVCNCITTRHLEALEVESGWSCIDVGAGRGSIACWLAERVGPSGHVVAADLNPRLLKRAQLPPNVEVREHDILTQDLEAAQYDVVHCRALLMHLPHPELVLRRMAAAVRPGGWLFVEEFDFSAFGAADVQYPNAEAFDQTTRACWDALRDVGRMDSYFGRRVPVLVAGLGFEDIGSAGEVLLGKGGDHPLGRAFSLTFGVSGMEALVGQGVVTRDAFDSMRALFDDDTFTFIGSIQFCVWGRRPSAES